ncbi:MAG: hypothetical protein QME61_03360 [Patescibacteria group bacterium]|nr:hypothetical protein [Patescibacteria group bacterium]
MDKKGISLTIALALISLQLALGLILGYFTARFLSGKQTGQQGIIKSILFQIGDYKIHLHHWLLSLGVLVFIFFFDFFYSQFLCGFLGGWIIQGIFSYKDWKEIIIKNKNDQRREY